MVVIPPVGSVCSVTLAKFPKHSFKIKIINTDVKDDSFGTIKYQILSVTNKRNGYKQEKVETYKTGRFNHKTGEYEKIPHTYMRDVRDANGNYIIEENKHVETETFTDRFSVVEELWFDEELTGRKVEICKN